jgi:Ca2+-binding RTX toxin-like protein
MPRRLPTVAATLAALALMGAGADRAAASYTGSLQAGTVVLAGDTAPDKITLRLRPGAPDILEADIGSDGTPDLLFDRSTFTAVDVEAGGGDDELRVDNSGGLLADEQITLSGGTGNDTLVGADGGEILLGGAGNDTAHGSRGNDTVKLGAGNDVATWDPGDGSDEIDGESGADRLDFHGANVSEIFGVSANGARVQLARNVANVALDFAGIERLALSTLGGTDQITVGDLAGTDLARTDVDLGADGLADTVIARGTDKADDVAFASAGNAIEVTGLAAGLGVTGGEAADVVRAETLDGDDTITSGVTTAGAATVAADGGVGADTALYKGTAAADTIDLLPTGAFAAGAAPLDATAVEDLDVLGLDGADTIRATSQAPPPERVTIDGGAGDDTLGGTGGNDLVLGGTGNDSADGNRGADTVRLGSGNDVTAWHPGDGDDTLEGQTGSDRLDFSGANIAEIVGVTANGPRVRLTRNVANVALDFDGIEALALRAFGGVDDVTVGDMTGTALKSADVALDASAGGGDAAADTVTVNGTDRPDRVNVTRDGDRIQVAGLAATTRITGSEVTGDTLRINTFLGDDTVTLPDLSGLINTNVDLGIDG